MARRSKINLRNLFLTKSQRSKSKSRSRSGSRRSSVGRVNSILNIDSKEKALEQINSIKSGNKMYTIHKANWCGYCIKLMDQLNRLMKEFNKAGKKITIQISTVDEEHSDMYNDVRKENGLSPVEEVESFPTIISEEKVPGSSNQINSNKIDQEKLIEKVNSAVAPTNATLGSPMSMAPGSPVANIISEEVISPELSEDPVSLSVSPISPPSLNADMIVTNSNNSNSKPPQVGGYGLYPAIASTAYHLAPAGILLAAAAATFKCKKGKGRRNRTRKGKGRR